MSPCTGTSESKISEALCGPEEVREEANSQAVQRVHPTLASRKLVWFSAGSSPFQPKFHPTYMSTCPMPLAFPAADSWRKVAILSRL